MTQESHIDPQEAIIYALSSGAKTPRQLKSVVTAQGVPRSTYHYHLRQLIKRGEVEDAKYGYKGTRVSDNVVQEILSTIGKGTEAQQKELSKNLEFLATKTGIALKPLFLLKIEECLSSKLTEVRRSALSALGLTLRNLSESPLDIKAREKIRARFYSILENLIKTDNDLDIKGRAIKILAALGEVRAVDIVIGMLEESPDDNYQQLKTYIKEAIVSPYHPGRRPINYLTRYYHPKILIRLSELAARGNKRASELAELVRHGASD